MNCSKAILRELVPPKCVPSDRFVLLLHNNNDKQFWIIMGVPKLFRWLVERYPLLLRPADNFPSPSFGIIYSFLVNTILIFCFQIIFTWISMVSFTPVLMREMTKKKLVQKVIRKWFFRSLLTLRYCSILSNHKNYWCLQLMVKFPSNSVRPIKIKVLLLVPKWTLKDNVVSNRLTIDWPKILNLIGTQIVSHQELNSWLTWCQNWSFMFNTRLTQILNGDQLKLFFLVPK